MQHNTDKEKATVCQKAPDKTQMDAMIQRSKDYGLKVAAQNMKTDTQTGRAFDIYDKGQHCQELEHTRSGEQSGTIASLQGELDHYKEHAAKLAEALRFTVAALSQPVSNYQGERLPKDYENAFKCIRGDVLAARLHCGKALAEYEAAQ